MDIKGGVLLMLAVLLVLLMVLGLSVVNANWETTAGYVAPVIVIIAMIGVAAFMVFKGR